MNTMNDTQLSTVAALWKHTWITKLFDRWMPIQKHIWCNVTGAVWDAVWITQLRSLSTTAEILFKDSQAFTRSASEWAAETNNLIPRGRRHLSSIDLFEVTTNTPSSFKACKCKSKRKPNQHRYWLNKWRFEYDAKELCLPDQQYPQAAVDHFSLNLLTFLGWEKQWVILGY